MFGEFLINRGIIDNKQLEQALGKQKQINKMLGETLVDLGFIEAENLDFLLKEHLLHRSDDILSLMKDN